MSRLFCFKFQKKCLSKRHDLQRTTHFKRSILLNISAHSVYFVLKLSLNLHNNNYDSYKMVARWVHLRESKLRHR